MFKTFYKFFLFDGIATIYVYGIEMSSQFFFVVFDILCLLEVAELFEVDTTWAVAVHHAEHDGAGYEHVDLVHGGEPCDELRPLDFAVAAGVESPPHHVDLAGLVVETVAHHRLELFAVQFAVVVAVCLQEESPEVVHCPAALQFGHAYADGFVETVGLFVLVQILDHFVPSGFVDRRFESLDIIKVRMVQTVIQRQSFWRILLQQGIQQVHGFETYFVFLEFLDLVEIQFLFKNVGVEVLVVLSNER